MDELYLPQFYTVTAKNLTELERNLFDFTSRRDWDNERIVSVSHHSHSFGSGGIFRCYEALITTEPR